MRTRGGADRYQGEPHSVTFDRSKISFRPLAERTNKVSIESAAVQPSDAPGPLNANADRAVEEAAAALQSAREHGRARMLTFGAHTIKNGLGPLIGRFCEAGWFTHLATNGAGIIHDWEFAFQGASSEDVRDYAAKGQFGAWDETGRYLNAALLVGAYEGRGYGESIGAMVEHEHLYIPASDELRAALSSDTSIASGHAGAAADLLEAIRTRGLPKGDMKIPHPFRRYGLQATAFRLGIPFTGHPMIGHDILYEHPLNHCAALGRCAERDFLRFVESVSNLQGGAYMSIGSAVMSPMVFEKSLSMARNVVLQNGEPIDDFFIGVVDLQESQWDWSRGEPPEDNPDYYLRYNKTFARMGGTLRYASADNRDFLLALARALQLE